MAKAMARGDWKPKADGAVWLNSSATQRRIPASCACRAVIPIAQSVRPQLSSDPTSSSQLRPKPMKLRNSPRSGFQACWMNDAQTVARSVCSLVPIAVISIVLSLVATLYPSWRASRVKPAEALRYD